MKFHVSTTSRALRLLTGVALASLATAVQAQESPVPAQPQTQAKPQQPVTVGEIIVTATRRSERLKDVPMNVTAITSADIAKNNLTEFSDVARLAPGLGLQTTSSGPQASLRGVSADVVSGTPTPAVDIYLNESSLNATVAFRSMYDIGQVEVLHGPQGTLRGETAPVGVITLETKRPKFNEYGATVGVIASDRDRWGENVQAAVNVPLIDDVLAVRIAGLADDNDFGGTRNPVTGAASSDRTRSVRASALFHPFEALQIFGMYQYMHEDQYGLARIEGAGRGYNGPPIAGGDNRAVQEATNASRFTSHVASLVAKLDLGSATLNYVGGYRKFTTKQGPGDLEIDPGNAILNFGRAGFGSSIIPVTQWTHELRLDSAGANRFWDYTVGVYQASGLTNVELHTPQVALPGAFGDPATYVPGSPPLGGVNGRYVSTLNLHLYGGDASPFPSEVNRSVFASSTFNFSTGTHVRLGARRIWYADVHNSVDSLDPAFIAAHVPFPTSLCPTFIPGSIASPVYPTSCDIPFSVPGALIDQHAKRNFSAWVYDINVRQQINKDLMVYVDYGQNWRGPGASQGNAPPQYFLVSPEVSKNYEIGMKGALFDRRVQFTAAVFQEDFKDYNASVTNVPFLDATNTVVNAFSLTFNGNARVRGVEADITGQIMDRWTVRGGLSYSKSNFINARVPCRDSNFDGVPDGGTPTIDGFHAAHVNVATCASNGPINGLPEWNFTAQSEYTMPIGSVEAYVRGLFTWKSDGLIVSSDLPVKSYGTLDLFGGARVGNADLGFFVKNVFDVERKFDQNGDASSLGVPSGYHQVFYTQGREVGVNLRWTFGAG